MKKSRVLLIKTLITLVCILCCISTIAYGAGTISEKYTGELKEAAANNAANSMVNIISSVLGVIRTIGAVVALVIFMIVAIKYILASAGEKADIKKYLTTYVIGGLILFGASGILGIIKLILDKSF